MTTTGNGQRDELALVITHEADKHHGFAGSCLPPAQQDRELAAAILAAGYRKPRTIGYVVVDQSNTPLMVNFSSREAAEDYAREQGERVSRSFRVAEIVEATQ